MKIATCPHCRARIDVSAIVPGGTVLCGGCRNPVRVPEAPSMPMAPVVRDAVPVAPSPAPAPAPSPAARGAAPAPRGTPGRSKPPRRPKTPVAAGARNPLPLLAAFGALVALAVAGIFWLAGSGDGKPGPAAEGPAGAKGETAAAKPEAALSELERGARTFGLEVPAYLDMLVNESRRSPEKARENHAYLLRQDRAEEAARVLEEAKRSFPYDPWVNGKLGLRDRTTDIQAVAGDLEMQDLLAEYDPFEKVLGLMDEMGRTPGSGWLDEEASRELDGWIESCREHLVRLRNPEHARTERLYRNLRYDPHFTNLRFGVRSARPWILFPETVAAEREEAFGTLVERRSRALLYAYRRFREFLTGELGLEAPPLERLDDRRLRVFVFGSRKSFDQWHLDTGNEYPGRALLAYYAPVHQMIVMHADLDQGAGSGGGGASLETTTCIHEAVHHLYDFYQRRFCDEAGKRIPEGHALMSPQRVTPDTLFWFQEGLADYFGAAEPVPGREGEWVSGRLDHGHLRSLAAARRAGQEWRVAEFLFADQAEIYDRAEMKNWGRRGADELKALMYAHGWLATHFFLHGDGGRWREKFLEYVRREIRGDHFRPDLDSLLRDLEGVGRAFQRNPAQEQVLRDRKDLSIRLQAWIQGQPELAKLLRVRDFLAAFGLPPTREDPKVQAWLREVEAGFRKYEQELLRQAK